MIIFSWNLTIFNSNRGSRRSPFLLIITMSMNLIFSSCWLLSLRKLKMNLLVSFYWIWIFSQYNNGCCLFFRCGYSTMNHAMCNPFLPIIIIFVIILLNSSIMKILLTVVLHRRLWLIIRGIVLSTSLPIMIWYFFTETICIWNYYILDNGWQMTIDWWPGTNNFNGIIF